MLRILHLNSMLKGGGTDDQCIKAAAGLRELGHQAAIAGPADRECSTAVREAGVPLHAIPSEGPAKTALILNVAKKIRREKIQILHAHHGRDYWPAILAAKLSGVRPRVVLTRHMAKSPSSWPSRKFLLNQCDALVAVSQFVATVLSEGVFEPTSRVSERRARPPIQGDHRKIHVVYGAIDTERFRPRADDGLRSQWGLSEGDFAFGMVGGFDLPHGKGQREFLQAAAQIHQQVPHARFLIIGRGNMEEHLRQETVKLGLTGKAFLTGQCLDMPRGMNALDCLVHAQIATEAFGLVVCEAFACGKPVIASRLDGIPEAFAFGEHGQLIGADSIDELAAALQTWANRPGDSAAHQSLLHQRIQNQCSLPVAAQRLAALYSRL
jgi:glycosyltransferase involved in cell wall biosynthesis